MSLGFLFYSLIKTNVPLTRDALSRKISFPNDDLHKYGLRISERDQSRIFTPPLITEPSRGANISAKIGLSLEPV